MNELIWKDGNEAATATAVSLVKAVKDTLRRKNKCVVALDDIPLWDALKSAIAREISDLGSDDRNKIFLVPLVRFMHEGHNYAPLSAMYLYDFTTLINKKILWEGPYVLGTSDDIDKFHIKQSLSEAFKSGMAPDITVASVSWSGGIYIPNRFCKNKKTGNITTIKAKMVEGDAYNKNQNLQLLSAQALWLAQRLFLCFPISGSQQEYLLLSACQQDNDNIVNALLAEHGSVTAACNTAGSENWMLRTDLYKQELLDLLKVERELD